MKNILPAILLTGLSLASCSQTNKNNTEDAVPAPREELRALLQSVQADGKTMFGHHDDPVYGHTWSADSGRSDVLELVGDYPAVMSWDLGGIELADSVNLDGVPFSRIRAEVAAQDARGGINVFSWHLRNAVNGGDSWDVSDSTLVARLANDSTANAAFAKQLVAVADFFNSLTDSQGNKIGVVFRPWHEHTGGWFFWGKPHCSVDDYKALWTNTRRVLDSMGVDNVLYAYSPDRVNSVEDYLERYPGDEVVDIVGTDIYHFNGPDGLDDFRSTATRCLAIVRQVARDHGKIPAFTETGSESLPMADWWTEVLLPIIKGNPTAYVVVWRNAHDKPNHFYTPYPGHAAERSFKAFYNDSTVLFAKDIR